ncbi:hypothetical protein ON021_11890, partial [Microcoleus sp. HI-ES]|nr:hypothetical protein [Microcoleus sp. HI-ES]
WPDLEKILPDLKADNDQKEYYLTDTVNFLNPVMAVDVEDYQEILGINDRKHLATACDILQTRIKDKWMTAGVTLLDPNSITIDDTVELQPDVVIEPQTHLRGNTSIASGSRIGPGSLISPVLDKNCQTNRKPKTPKIGGKIFGEFFFQNSPKAPCALPPLRLVLTAMLLISYVW